MIFMPQIFDVTANENARYKRNELELIVRASNQLAVRQKYFILVNMHISGQMFLFILAIKCFLNPVKIGINKQIRRILVPRPATNLTLR